MNKLFLDDLVERLEMATYTTVNVYEQKDVLRILQGVDGVDKFPMICYETTPDNSFNVSTEESKFLNDKAYNGTWIIGYDDDTVSFLICLSSTNPYSYSLHIDAFEINEDMRGEGLGGNIISVIESLGESYYETIVVSPFDTDSMNFWEHMGYKESNGGNWVKNLNE